MTAQSPARALSEHVARGSFFAGLVVCSEFQSVVATPLRLARPFGIDRGLLEGVRLTPCACADRGAALALNGCVSFGHGRPDRAHALEGRQGPLLLRV